MKTLIRFFILLCCSSLYSTALADNFFCPNTLRYISTGTTEYQVEQACGAPIAKQDVVEPEIVEIPIEQLFYQPQAKIFDKPTNKFLERVDINLSFTVENDRVRSIRLAGEEVASTTLCPSGFEVKVGDPAYNIRTACGTPGFVNRTTREEEVGLITVTLWTYYFNEYQPEVVFRFVEGILMEIIQDQPPVR